jgi:hypothetical protein
MLSSLIGYTCMLDTSEETGMALLNEIADSARKLCKVMGNVFSCHVVRCPPPPPPPRVRSGEQGAPRLLLSWRGALHRHRLLRRVPVPRRCCRWSAT